MLSGSEFRQELLQAIQDYLSSEFLEGAERKDLNKNQIVFSIPRGNTRYELSSEICQRVPPVLNINSLPSDIHVIDLQDQPINVQEKILNLLNCIEHANSVYHLWNDIKNRLKQMPSSLRWFNDLRPLVIALQKVLQDYEQSTLRKSDEDLVKNALNELHEKISALLSRIKSLIKECKRLKKEILELRFRLDEASNQINSKKIMEENIKLIQADKEKIGNALVSIKLERDAYREEVHALHDENRVLFAEVAKRDQQLQELMKEYSILIDNNRLGDFPSTSQPSASNSTPLDPEEMIQFIRRMNAQHARRKTRTSHRPASTLWQQPRERVSTEASCEISPRTRSLSSSNG